VGADERKGIHYDDAKQATGGLVCEPETRHAPNLGPLGRVPRPSLPPISGFDSMPNRVLNEVP
jgi:hypothetical protein